MMRFLETMILKIQLFYFLDASWNGRRGCEDQNDNRKDAASDEHDKWESPREASLFMAGNKSRSANLSPISFTRRLLAGGLSSIFILSFKVSGEVIWSFGHPIYGQRNCIF